MIYAFGDSEPLGGDIWTTLALYRNYTIAKTSQVLENTCSTTISVRHCGDKIWW